MGALGRHLTDEERQLLIANTERLIQQFETEHQAEHEAARKAELEAAHTAPVLKPSLPLPPQQPTTVVRPVARHVSEAQAKQIVRTKYNVDPELPGWRGLVLQEMERMDKVG